MPASAYGVNVSTFSPFALRGLTVKRHWIAAVIWAACCTGPALAQTAPPETGAGAAAQATPAPTRPRPEVRTELLPRPRLRIGRSFSIELTAKVQGDVSRFDPVVNVDDEDFEWRRRRLGIRGELFNRIQFEVEREFGDQEEPWRDVYLNVRGTDLIEVRAGKFKVPFGLDNSTGSTSHDFVHRSLGTRTLSPGRDVGIMAHGRADGRLFSYAVGVFDGDDAPVEDAFFDDDNPTSTTSRTVAGRVTAQPFDRRSDVARAIKNLELGVSGAWSKVPEGLNGFEGRSVYRYDFFEPVYVKGSRVRAGVDAAMFAGPTSLKAEWMTAWDERLNQGLGDVDLSKAFVRGWYVAGTWLVTGEDKEEDVRPRRPFLQGGIGAIELAARYERLLFGSTADDTEPAFANPRAENLFPNRDDVTTLGLTWHLNRWFKLQGNAIRESFDDVTRAPILGEPHYWSYVGRAQFAF